MMNKIEHIKKNLGGLSNNDFGNLGLEDTAYIKCVVVDGQKLHAIHAADGTPLTVVAERDTAFATVRQHEMQPASVH
ncbi:MAG: DUF1150 family protein [Bdellovibrionales bacterium]